MNPKVDTYLIEGCGRCDLGNTPECKVNLWQKELRKLRAILLDCGLTEELKWGSPCYTFEKNNVSMLGSLRESCVLSFLKGSLLNDADGILTKPGENSQAARVIRFTKLEEIIKIEPVLRAYIFEAIDVEKAGLKVEFKTNPEPIPEELQNKFNEDPSFKTAFFALTPGRQRGYILHFSAPKQSKTRVARIEKCQPQIFEGIGFHDRK